MKPSQLLLQENGIRKSLKKKKVEKGSSEWPVTTEFVTSEVLELNTVQELLLKKANFRNREQAQRLRSTAQTEKPELNQQLMMR